MLKNALKTLVIWLSLSGLASADSVQFNSLPPESDSAVQKLHGAWQFRYFPSSDAGKDEEFYQSNFSVKDWQSIKVPGHWEMQGFAAPYYAGDLKEGLGLYRLNFKAKKPTAGGRCYLRFDGVLFGFTAWVNGKKLGEWNAGFNPVTFDVTDALHEGEGENVLAVRVSTRSRGWDFDTMDCWSISGIYRDVTLYTLPATHLLDHTVRTTLAADGSAEISLQAKASRASQCVARLRSPQGAAEAEVTFKLETQGQGQAQIKIAKPQLWSAESPSLYALELELRDGDQVVERIQERVGIRQVTIEDGVLKLNGRPIKLHGVDHHDIWPEEGRVATEARVRRDLELMLAANINFIRTSHYPPHPLLLKIADELGIYVDCEVPFIHGRQHLKDPTFQEDLYTRARATVARDKNHPCIIYWSVGNENPVNPLGLNAGKLVTELDATRPVTFPTMGSHFKSNWEKFPEHVSIYAPHYPNGKTIDDYASKLKRPTIATEYAHMRGISRGGNGLQDAWDAMMASPRMAGGAIWHFEDQGLLRTAQSRSDVPYADKVVWLDEHRYYDTMGFFGVDGIVYSDRTPQVDFWWVRKVYAPVQIEPKVLESKAGADGFELKVENRYDFQALDGFKLQWTLRRNLEKVSEGTLGLKAVAHGAETIKVPARLPEALAEDAYFLELRCLDKAGKSMYERSVKINTPADGGKRWANLQQALAVDEPVLKVDEAQITLSQKAWHLAVDRHSGSSVLVNSQGQAYITACGPHTARKLTITESGKHNENIPNYWEGELLSQPKKLQTSAEKTAEGILIKVSGSYARPGHPEQSVDGEYRYLAKTNGVLEVSYHYVPVNAKDSMVEVGFAFAVPAALSEFRWLGQGPYASYIGKDRHAEYGVYHLNREDIYFPGNRRGVEFATLTAPTGAGLLLAGDNANISVEHRGPLTLFSHLAESSSKNSKVKLAEKSAEKDDGVEVKSDFKASSVKAIEGRFTLVPLQNTWPQPLERWLGSPNSKVEAFHPFLSSYDQ